MLQASSEEQDETIVEEPDVSHLITEDDEPLDNPFSEMQQKLLGDVLQASYEPGVPFVCLANVGLFHKPENTILVPDCMLSLDVKLPEDIWEKGNRAYMVWRFGKPPELVIEVVSNTAGGEEDRKLELYQLMRVSYYAIFDPNNHLGKRALRLYELRGSRYVEVLDPTTPLEQLGLSLVLWDGEYAQFTARWLRFRDLDGTLLQTGLERAATEAQRADTEAQRAEQALERIKELERQLEERD